MSKGILDIALENVFIFGADNWMFYFIGKINTIKSAGYFLKLKLINACFYIFSVSQKKYLHAHNTEEGGRGTSSSATIDRRNLAP